jgi:hypothetical protein
MAESSESRQKKRENKGERKKDGGGRERHGRRE